MSSTNRKEQIFNSAGGLAANLFEKFNKLKHQQQQQQQQQNQANTLNNTNESSQAANLLGNLTIGFQKNQNLNQLNTSPNLLIISDDGIDDTNIDPINEIKQSKQPLIKSNSASPQPSAPILLPIKQLSQSQSDYEIKNDSPPVNNIINIPTNNSSTGSLAPSSSSKMTTSSSLFKLSSGFIDDLKTDILNKTNSYVDEAEEALRKRFLKKKKSSDSMLSASPSSSHPPDLSKIESANTNASDEAEVPEAPAPVKADTPIKEVKFSDEPQIKIEENTEPAPKEEVKEVSNVREEEVAKQEELNQTGFNVNILVLVPVCSSIVIFLVIKLLNSTNSSFFSVILVYLCGFLTGSLIVSLVIAFILLKYNLIRVNTEQPVKTDLEESETKTSEIHSLLIQTAVHKQNKNFDGVYKSWMNELREKYDPDTYFLNKTRSVYASLDGVMLRLQTTTHKIPKRAVHSEKIGYVQFNDQRIYDLTDCECHLLPKELVRKRYWSKKYPLCLRGVKLQSSNSLARKQSISQSPSSQLNTIESVDDLQLDESTLILFARTDREKEEWYKLFKKASARNLLDSASYLNQKKSSNKMPSSSKLVASSNNDSSVFASTSPSVVSYDSTNDKLVYKLVNELDTLTNKETDNSASSADLNNNNVNNNESGTQTVNGLLYDTSLNFMNTFLIRMFNDFFTHKFWIDKIRTKMQNKLNTLKMPYFMEELRIIDLDLGFMIPLIKQTSEPWYDDKGLWCHLDIDYSGGIQILFSTKLNLMKLKANEQESANQEEEVKQNKVTVKKRLHLGMINSDEEDSPESSGDEYVHTDNTDSSEVVETANKSKKILNLVNKIAASNYFQKATEMKYIKKAMENVSNCQLLLNVEVKKISGTLALNIPPHPSDRIWYGFASAPQMVLTATPQVGDKEVSYSAISDWIAEKLKQEFQKVLVFPNMDDFYIPILNSELEYKSW